MRAVPGNKHMVGGVSKKSSLLVLYEVRADTEENKRKPFDLVVVLDKSGFVAEINKKIINFKFDERSSSYVFFKGCYEYN